MKNQIRLTVLTAAIALTASSVFAQSGADTYKSKCQMCHAADGSGDTPAGKSMKTPSFLSSDLVSKSDADLITATKNGVGKMPAYSGKLTDAQIKDVVTFVRTLQKK